MLLEFKYKNFLSYKDETRFLMTKVKSFKELENDNCFKESSLDLLKTAAVYGTNGGGKSNFINAVVFMKSVIHNSFSESLKKEEDRGRKDFYHKLNLETTDKESFFEVSFLRNTIIYRYGFEIRGYEIIKEWLTQKINTETPLFERNLQNFNINNKTFSEGVKHKNDVNSNVLFISHLAQNNGKISTEIFQWFENLNAVSGLKNKHYENVTKHYLSTDLKFKIWLSNAVKFLNISDVATNSENKIIAYHNKYDKNDIIVESISFDLDMDESEGTKKLIYLLGAVYDTILNGKILFIDELDSKLHPNMTKKLMFFFHKFNLTKAQFIFTAHDAILLDRELLRRDQIWFVDKNKFGSSELYSMSDFDAKVVRNTSDFRKKYLEMTFGAANSIQISDQLIALMYGK